MCKGVKRNLKYNNMTIEELIKEANKRNMPYLINNNKYVISNVLRLTDKIHKIELILED